MALRVIEPFLNFSHAYSAVFVGYGPQMLDRNVPYVGYCGDTSGYGRTYQAVVEDGWLKVFNIDPVSGYRTLGLARLFTNMGITITATSVLFGGVRMKVAGAVPSHLITTQGVSAQAILVPGQVPGGFKLNTEYYFEWCLDLVNSLIRVRVDGIEVTPTVMAPAVRNALIAGGQYLMYGSWQTNVQNALYYYLKDGYILEKTPDGLMSGWLGPQVIRQLPVAEATAPWTTTGNVPLKDALNSPINSAATRLTPLAATDVSATEGIIKFDPTPVKGKLNGISVNISMQKQAGKIGSFEASFTTGGVESSKSTTVATNDMLMFQEVQLSSKAPNGNPWSAENLATSTLKLKPVS